MDMELLSVLRLSVAATLDKDRAGVSSRQPSENQARVIWLYVSKRVWLSLQMFYSSDGCLDAAYLRFFPIFWQNESVRQHNAECVVTVTLA